MLLTGILCYVLFLGKQGTDVEMVDATSPKTNTKQVVTASEKKVVINRYLLLHLAFAVLVYCFPSDGYVWHFMQPKTPATTQSTGSKTLFVGNLPFDVEQDDVYALLYFALLYIYVHTLGGVLISQF